MRPDKSEQLSQRSDDRLASSSTPRLGASGMYQRSATQGNGVIPRQRYQHHGKVARTLALRLAVQVKSLCSIVRTQHRRFALGTPRHGLQQLASVVVITTPQQGCAFTG